MTPAKAHASPRSSLLQLGEAHGEHGEVSSLDGSGGGQYSIEALRQDLERCPLCYEDVLLFPLPCHPLHRLCTLCAYDPRVYAHMTPGFKDAHGDAHPMDSQGTSKNHPPPPQGPRPETKITWTLTQNIPKWTSIQRTRLGGFPRPPLPPRATAHSLCELYYKIWWIQNGHASSSILRCTSPRCARLRWGRMRIYMCTSVHATYNTSSG